MNEWTGTGVPTMRTQHALSSLVRAYYINIEHEI